MPIYISEWLMNHTFREQTQSLANNNQSELRTESSFNKQSFQLKFNQDNCPQKENKHWRKKYAV